MFNDVRAENMLRVFCKFFTVKDDLMISVNGRRTLLHEQEPVVAEVLPQTARGRGDGNEQLDTARLLEHGHSSIATVFGHRPANRAASLRYVSHAFICMQCYLLCLRRLHFDAMLISW